MYQLLRHWRDSLTDYRSLIPYAILGISGGLISALLIIAFDAAIGLFAQLLMVGDNADGFESLPRELHFALPVTGAFVLGLIFSRVKAEHRDTGIVHVLRRMHTSYGALPGMNAVMQFIGGVIAMATGQSGGREGPGVHLGGAIVSLCGQYLHLPSNSLRLLVACGAAGGISVAFNTPLAGVIFAMEVILCEYTVVGFLPIVLATASADLVSHYLRQGDPIFNIPAVSLTSVAEVPLILILGVSCGIVTAVFIRINRLSARLQKYPIVVRFVFAGLLTGTLALWVPEILGLGYDTLEQILKGSLTIQLLLLICLCKLLATAVSCGIGLPVGMIGPNLLIGACVGSVFGLIAPSLLIEYGPQPLLYVVIGMAATMGTLLGAPLAAILAVVEMTQTVTIVMPAMLAIVAATLVNRELFKQSSAHQMALRNTPHLMPQDPLNQLLHRTHVSTCMDTNVSRLSVTLSTESHNALRHATPKWCLLERGQQALYLVRGSDALAWLEENPATSDSDARDINDMTIQRWSVASVPVQASLRQALDAIHAIDAQAVCIYGRDASRNHVLLGVVTLKMIEEFTLNYLKPPSTAT